MYVSYDNQCPKYVRCTHTGQLVDAYPLSVLARQDVTWSTLLRDTTKRIIMKSEFHLSGQHCANDGLIFQLVQTCIHPVGEPTL